MCILSLPPVKEIKNLDRDKFLSDFYKNHDKEVRQAIDANRLFIFNSKQGWSHSDWESKIKKLLPDGVVLPGKDEKFPHMFKRDDFKEMQLKMVAHFMKDEHKE